MRILGSLALLITMVMSLIAPTSIASADQASGDESAVPTNTIDFGIGSGAIPEGKIGSEIAINLPLINRGEKPVTHVLVTPKPSVAPNHFPFEITRTDYTVAYRGTIAPQQDRPVEQAQVNLALGNFRIRDGLVTGYYAMPLAIQFAVDGQNYVIERALFIKVNGVDKPSSDGEETKPVIVEVPKYIEIPVPAGQNGFEGMGIDQAALSALSDQSGGSAGDDGGQGSIPRSASMPRVMLTSFTTNPATVSAGEEFDLTFTLQNMSSGIAASNMRATLASAQGELLPVNGAASVYIDYLGAGQSTTQTLRFRALPNLEERPYQLAMQIDFDANGTPGQSAETLAVVVVQKARVDIASLQVVPDTIAVGEDASVTFAINNRGKSQLFNTTVKLKDGQKGVRADESFIGTVAPGTSTNADLLVHVSENITQPIKIEIVHEDSSGRSSSIEKEISITVIDEPDPFAAGDVNERKSGSSIGSILIPLFLLLLIAALVALFIIMRKRKAKKEADLDRQMEALGSEDQLFDENGTSNGMNS